MTPKGKINIFEIPESPESVAKEGLAYRQPINSTVRRFCVESRRDLAKSLKIENGVEIFLPTRNGQKSANPKAGRASNRFLMSGKSIKGKKKRPNTQDVNKVGSSNSRQNEGQGENPRISCSELL